MKKRLNQPFKPFSHFAALAALVALAMPVPPVAQAQQSGVWTNLVGGSWANSANWGAGAIANGTDSIANFSQLNLSAAPTVTLNGAQSIGSLIFGDKGNTYGWTLNTGSGGPLTLAVSSGSPIITVNGQTTTVGLVLDGTQGLTKDGAGTLVLTNANTFTGGLTVSNGTVQGNFTSLAPATDLINSGNAITNAGGFLIIKGNASGATSQTFSRVLFRPGGGGILGDVNGGAGTTINLGAGFTNSIAGGSLLIGSSGANDTGLVFTTTSKTNSLFPGNALVVNTYGPRIVYTSDNGTTVDWATTKSSASPYAITNYTAYTTVSSSGIFTNWNPVGTNYSIAGGISVTSTVLTRPQTLKMFGGSSLEIGTNKMNIQNGGLLCVGSAACSISGAAAVASISGICGNFGNNTPYDFVVQQYNTAGLNVSAGFCDPLPTGGPLSLTKAGPGTLTLTGTNQFTGVTYINAGTLTLTGAGQLSTNTTPNYAGRIVNNGVFNYASSKAQTLSGGISGIGTLTNAGPGTLTLTGTNTYTGTTTITGGTLALSGYGCLSNTAVITINGGTLALAGVTNVVGSAASPIGKVNLTNSTLQLPADANTTNICASSLNVAGTNNIINISALPTLSGYPSQFPLISYTSYSGGSIKLGTLPGTYQGYVSNDTASLVIFVVVTNASAKPVVWGGGVNNLWNTTTLNWTNAGVAASYTENDNVSFDDLGKTNLVNLVSSHTPGTLAMTNNVLNYTFTGVGSIGGVVGLNKQGSASLTLAETGGDNFSGGIVVGGGTVILDNANSAISGGVTIGSGATLQIGNNSTNGILPTGTLDNQGTLAFKRTDNVVLSTVISGIGGLTQNGSGKLTLSATNTYTGNTTVLQGTLALGVADAVNSSAQIDISNGTLDLSAVTASATLSLPPPLTLTNSTLMIGAPYPLTSVSLNSLSVGGTANTINVSALPLMASYPVTVTLLQSASPISGNNFVLGSLPPASPAYGGTLSLSGDQTTLYLTLTNGPLVVNVWNKLISGNASGSWNIAGSPPWSNGALPATNATADFSTLDITANSTVTLDSNQGINTIIFGNTDASPNANWNLSPGTPSTSTLTLNGTTPTITVNDLGSSKAATISATIIGTAGLTKTGTGTLILSGTNTYTGVTTVSAGAMEVTGTLQGNGKFVVKGNAGLTFNSPGKTSSFTSTTFRDIAIGSGTGVVGTGTMTSGTVNVDGVGSSANLGLVVGENGGTGTLTVNGGTLNVQNWLLIGRNKVDSFGTLNLNGGLVNLGYLGGYTSGSGRGTLFLGNFSPGSIINLNAGGTLALNCVFGGSQGSFNFNGGTLIAQTNNTRFFNGNTLPLVVQSGGAIISDGGFAITITNELTSGASPDGGLIKLGSGTLTLSGANSYNGMTTVSNGTLLVNGSVAGLVTVASGTLGGTGEIDNAVTVQGGQIAPGTNGIGTLTLTSNLTLNASSSVSVQVDQTSATSDFVTGLNNVTYAGTLTVTNLTGTLTNGSQFTLFSAANPSGNFSSISGSPGAGLAWSFNPTNGVLSVVTGVATNPTNITFSVSGNTLNLSWPADHLGWLVQSNSVNLAVPANWHDIPSTAAGTNYSTTIDATKTNVFYRLRMP